MLQENAADEDKIALIKNITDVLEADYYNRMQVLDSQFIELNLGTPGQEDYALMQDAITMLQEQIRDSNNLEYTDNDYEEVTKEFYEELLDEEGIMDRRGRAVIDFVINRLKCVRPQNFFIFCFLMRPFSLPPATSLPAACTLELSSRPCDKGRILYISRRISWQLPSPSLAEV